MSKRIGNLLTIREVIQILRISEPTFYRYVRAGKIKTIKISRKNTRISEKELNKLLKRQTK
ncbi:MAG: helix-turn-helix domain-containing protein [Candidatus Portnoybacteria bacterium]|nr:helix-turn-helix domain-containing protein [Candidatus Portnoybacteria bacterium]